MIPVPGNALESEHAQRRVIVGLVAKHDARAGRDRRLDYSRSLNGPFATPRLIRRGREAHVPNHGRGDRHPSDEWKELGS